MNNDEKYSKILEVLPEEIINKFLEPLGDKDPLVHKNIVNFLILLYEKGYCVKKR